MTPYQDMESIARESPLPLCNARLCCHASISLCNMTGGSPDEVKHNPVAP